MSSPAAPNEIVTSRVFAYPPERLFEAFSDPQQLTLWFGPNGFTSTFEIFDFQPGGDWIFTFHGPDGTDYPNRCVFAEIVPSERIVYDHVVAPRFRMSMTMEAAAESTRLTWIMAFESDALCKQLKPICMPANEENFDRLTALLSRS